MRGNHPSYLAHWYYHLPDLLLTALICLLMARLVLKAIPGFGTTSSPIRLLVAVTDPVLKGVGALTPRLVPQALVIVCAAAWLLAARVLLFVAVSATGVRLSMG